MKDSEPVDQVIGRYRLRYRVGRGGMGSVYLAETHGPAGFKKRVALKVVHSHLLDDEQFLRMFLDEARISASLQHPNVCTVFDFGKADGTFFLAMEWLLGETLDVISRAGPPPELVARIGAHAARGLHAAHELCDESGAPLGLVHRDVSPHNIVVLYDGPAKVVDFGIASARDRVSHTTEGAVKGKLAYMSPEQLDGGEVDRRTDIFALGTVLWEAALGWPLFKRGTASLTIRAVLEEEILSPRQVLEDFPAELEAVIMRALERDPEQRFQTMEAFAEALEEAIGEMGQPAGTAQVSSWMKEALGEHFERRLAMVVAAAEGEDEDRPAERAIPEGDETPLTTASARHDPGASTRRWLYVALALLATVAAGWAWNLRPHGDEGRGGASRGGPAVARLTSTEGGPSKSDGPPFEGDVGEHPPQDGGDSEGGAAAVTPSDAATDGGAEPSTVDAVPETAPSAPPPERAPPPGYAHILSIPTAEVWDGRRHLGTTPLRRVRLSAGRHMLKLRSLSTGTVKRVPVRVRSGETSAVSVRLDP